MSINAKAPAIIRKVAIVSKPQRSIWDDIIELGREVIENIDDALNPEKRRKPVPVPIPVRRNYPPARHPDNNYPR